MLIPSLREEIYRSSVLAASPVEVIDFMNTYCNTLQSWDLGILAVPDTQFSMEVFEQHTVLFEQLKQAKAALDPVVKGVNEREHLLELEKELERIMQDPSRYTDRRNNYKMWAKERRVRGRLNRQRLLEKEVRRLPPVDDKLIQLIGEYELHNGEVIIHGEHYLRLLREETEGFKARTVGVVSVCDG